MKKQTPMSRLKGILRTVQYTLAPSPVFSVVEESHPLEQEQFTLLEQIHHEEPIQFHRYYHNYSHKKALKFHCHSEAFDSEIQEFTNSYS